MSEAVTPHDLKVQMAEMALAQAICAQLEHQYPDHPWAVNVTGGVAQIFNAALSLTWGYIVKLADVVDDPSKLKRAVRIAGGEILERAKIQRRGGRGAEADVIRDLRGNAKFES